MAQVSQQLLMSSDAQDLIERIVKDANVKYYGIETSAGSVIGDNYLGIIAKVVVRGETESGKKKIFNFIVKSAPRNGFMRSFAPMEALYEREIYIYDTIFREFENFQEEKKVAKPFKSFAKYYASLVNDTNEIIIMENMKELGYKLWDRRRVFDYNHVLMAMKEYGKFHALSFALRDQKPDLFQKFAENSQEKCFCATLCNDAIKQGIELQGNRALNTLDAVEDKKAYELFSKFVGNMMENVKDAVAPEVLDRYAVIGHGDCWINNMLFKYEKEEAPNVPTKICFLDWQLSRIGSPALDLSYLIFSSTDEKLREEHYESLIKEYYYSFSNHLIELGSDPEQLFPFEALQDQLKKFSVYGLYMAITIVFMITREAEEIMDVNSEISKEELEGMLNAALTGDDVYIARMRGVILDFVKYNYL